ncbi:MAG: 3-phosphoserine/phosphohydroxythreonine transaminase [Flavobacteriales bacterium]|nr:3-phosphoserine/phosphohydroxythreonine transaminase [Flavobacteriales bacterium]
MSTKTKQKVHNYSAGPCILPSTVFEKASAAVLDLDGSGLSILEISHRSKPFVAIMEKARALVKELLDVPEGYSILFLGGGASTGFFLVPMNYMKVGGKAAYTDTGTWASNAIKEAQGFGEVDVVASSADKDHTYIPKGHPIPSGVDYFHFTSNNTIYGTQYKDLPTSSDGTPVICDMSSDIFSRPVNVADFAMIYAGAQKNMGPAGTTLYIVKDELLGRTGRSLGNMMDLRNHIKKESMFNTPPVYPVYVSMLTLEWMKEQGGVKAMQERSEARAGLLYGAIDELPLFEGTTAREDRSSMNATFRLTNTALEETFDAAWKEAGISGLRGHRSVGGYRASMYNALPLESVQVLVDVMHEFAKKNG